MTAAHRADVGDPEYCPNHERRITSLNRDRYAAFGVGAVGGAGLLISLVIPLGGIFDAVAGISLIGGGTWQAWQVVKAGRLRDELDRCGPCRIIRRRPR